MVRKCDLCKTTMGCFSCLEKPGFVICKNCVEKQPYPDKTKYWPYGKTYCSNCHLNVPKSGKTCQDCLKAIEKGLPTPVRSCNICLIQKAKYYNKWNEPALCEICYDNSTLIEQTKYKKNKDNCGICHLKRATVGLSKDNLTHCRNCFQEDIDTYQNEMEYIKTNLCVGCNEKQGTYIDKETRNRYCKGCYDNLEEKPELIKYSKNCSKCKSKCQVKYTNRMTRKQICLECFNSETDKTRYSLNGGCIVCNNVLATFGLERNKGIYCKTCLDSIENKEDYKDVISQMCISCNQKQSRYGFKKDNRVLYCGECIKNNSDFDGDNIFHRTNCISCGKKYPNFGKNTEITHCYECIKDLPDFEEYTDNKHSKNCQDCSDARAVYYYYKDTEKKPTLCKNCIVKVDTLDRINYHHCINPICKNLEVCNFSLAAKYCHGYCYSCFTPLHI